MLSYYEILQVSEDASSADIKKAYRKLCKILHPDMHDNSKEANVIFNLLHEAYDTLSDPTRKRNYNPKQHSSTSNAYDFTSDKYDEIISGYKKIVKDYERIIKSKDKREKELLEEINNLKQSKDQKNDNHDIYEEYSSHVDIDIEDEKQESEPQEELQKEGYDVWTIIIYILFGIVVLGVFVLFVVVPDVWWVIIFLLGLPVWLIYSAFK